MAEDNPFLSFFESVGVGMEAGRQRRSLMERSRRGEQVDVPSLGATILSGISRAATPANTRLAQDELKLRAANYALDRKIQQDRYQAQAAAETAKRAAEAREAEAELRDSVVYTEAVNAMNQFLVDENLSGLQKFQIPSNISQSTASKLWAEKRNLLAGERSKRLFEMRDMREALAGYFPPDQIPNTYEGMKRALDGATSMGTVERVTGISEKLGAGSVTVNVPGGSFTVRKPEQEEIEGYSKKELADRIIETNELISRAQGSDTPNPQAIDTLRDTFDMLKKQAKDRGWTDIVPGGFPEDDTPPADEGTDDWLNFQETLKSFVTPNL